MNIKQFSEIKETLSASGCRWTRSREAILETFFRVTSPISSAAVYRHIVKVRVDLASVYRTIRLFVARGVLVEVDLSDEGRRYELSDKYRSHHHHLICQNCGKTEDLNDCMIGDLQKKIARKTHFQIYYHDLKFLGACQDCAA